MSQSAEHDHEGVRWQRGIWQRYPEIYQREIDQRFVPVVQQVIRRAALSPGQHVLDLGTGTGSVALQAAALVAPHGGVLAVDLSPAMLAVAQQRARAMGLGHVWFREGRAEAIPADDGAVHVVLASLSLMYAIDRAAAAREIARVLRPDGRFVAAVWAGPEAVRHCAVPAHRRTFCAATAGFRRRPGRLGRSDSVSAATGRGRDQRACGDRDAWLRL